MWWHEKFISSYYTRANDFFSKCDIASMIDHIQMLKIHYQCCTFKCGRKGQGGSPDVEAISYESEGHLLGGLMIRVNWG